MSSSSGLRRRVSNDPGLARPDTPEQSNHEVAEADLLPSAPVCSAMDQTVVQGTVSSEIDVDAVAEALDAAHECWRLAGDVRALRRRLLALLARLEGDPT